MDPTVNKGQRETSSLQLLYRKFNLGYTGQLGQFKKA